MVELSFEFLIFFPDKSFFDEIFREKKTKEKENEKLKIDYVSQIIIYLDSIDTRLNLLKKKIEWKKSDEMQCNLQPCGTVNV